LCTRSAARIWAVDLFSTTYFSEIIIFVVSKDQTFRIRCTLMNPEEFLILVPLLLKVTNKKSLIFESKNLLKPIKTATLKLINNFIMLTKLKSSLSFVSQKKETFKKITSSYLYNNDYLSTTLICISLNKIT
jgi:hypothetical protein